MPRVQTFPVGPFATNCYLLSQDGQGILIDPGEEGDFLSEQIVRNNLDLQAIILTHGHFDHVLGLLSLHLNFPNVPIYLNPADNFLYQQAVSSAKHWVGEGYSPDPPPEVQELSSQGLSLKDSSFITLPTPGHTPGSVCFYLPAVASAKEGLPLLFSGDTLFKQAVGRTDLSYSDPDELQDSLTTLSQLPPDTVIYPGHGDPTTIRDAFPEAEMGFAPTNPRFCKPGH